MSKGRPVGIQRCGRAANSIVASLALAACFLAGASAGGAAPTRDPNEGPGGPILVVADPGNAFSRYYAEILRTEGFNAFAVVNIGQVDAQLLDAHVLVILGEQALDATQAALLADWVSAGGKLIAMRPDADLAALLGLGSSAGSLSDAYLRIDTAADPGAGLVAETIQFHGTANLLPLAGASAVATLYADAFTATAYPAVTRRPVGTLGGEAAAFAYDLARSVVLTRQGNPAWFGMDRDGDGRVRSNDPFVGDTPGVDDWIDLDKVAIPQADEQQRLLGNLMLAMCSDRLPLPRFWYFPATADGEAIKAVVIMTMDDHGGAYTATRMNEHLAQSPPDCSLEDWECVRASAYMYTANPMTDAQADYYDALGFEIALHIDTGCDSPWADYAALAAIYAAQHPPFVAKYASIPPPSSERGHCVTWADWASKPKLQALYGIRLDTTYYYEGVGPWAINAHPGMYTGSGIPMRFADLDGTLIDVYQATTQMTDESGQSYPFTIDALLDKAVGPEGYYGAFTANMHSDNGPPWNGSIAAPQIVSSAQTRGVPVVSGRQMLSWLDGRGASAFGGLAWNRGSLSFSITRAPAAHNLEGMLPIRTGFGELTDLRRAGEPVAYHRIETIKGVEYAFFAAESGAYSAEYTADETPPVISAVQHSLDQGGSAHISWNTDEEADSRVDYGLDPELLDESVLAGSFVLAHGLTLSGLEANTTYYYRVSSADPWGNAATQPPLAQSPLSFTTPPPVCFADDTAADFAAGSPDAGVYIAESSNGELILAPAVGAEFGGEALPAGWSGVAADPGGTFVVSGGQLTLDGARAQPTSFYAHPVGGEVRVLDFVATFQAAQHQHAGFGITFQEYPYAIFSTTESAAALYVHTQVDGGIGTTQLLSASWLGAPHHYRIEWSATGATYFIDGAQVAQHAHAIATDLRPVFYERYLGGPTLTVDWARMSPYSAAGSFASHVYDAGAPATWSIATWNGDEPAGTATAIAVRTGDTPLPDGSWSAFVPLPASGTDIAGSSQFIQYRATLTSSDPGLTPALADLAISCDAGEDTQPPFILALTATPDAGGMAASITWTTNEPATSRVDYGSDPDLLANFVSDGTLGTYHALALTGLTPGGTYYYRASSADALANNATEPPLAEAPAVFSTPAPPAPPCFVETAVADFAEGTPDAGIVIGDRAGGELILAPGSGSEFGGSTLAADWEWGYRPGGGLVQVSGGKLILGDAWAGTSARLPAGRSVEFVATFTNEVQHAGFSELMNGPDFAIFTCDGAALNARTFWGNGAGNIVTPLGSSYLNAPHRYRIVWNATSAVYYIDDNPTPVATHAHAMTLPERFCAMDSDGSSNHFVLDWVRVTPYAASGSFESQVCDAGAVSDWVAASWESALPSGSIAVSVRTGDNPSPPVGWTDYVPIAASGDPIGASSRYVQYRAQLTNGDPAQTPELQAITLTCELGEDVTSPNITALAALPGADGTTASVSWTTDEAADSRVDYGLTPGLLNLNATSAALVSSHALALSDLIPGATYYFRARSADAAANSSTAPPIGEAPASFTTPLPACAVDDLTADFAGGAGSGTWIAETGNGELILMPASGGEFGGSALAGDWESGLRAADGIVQVSGGRLRLGAAWAGTLAYLPAGRSLEFVATFTNEIQHAGFATDLGGGDFAIFTCDGATLSARSYWGNGAGNTITPLGSGTLNAPHRYRIVWNTTTAEYYIDDNPTPVATHAHAMTLPLRFIAMDSGGSSNHFVLDWARVTPYAASGSFESRVFDGDEPVFWDAMTWVASLPAGTSLALSARTGDSPTPGGAGWTAFTSVASSGTSVDQIGRYLQYRAELASSDPALSPALESLSILCGSCLGAPPALTALVAEQLREGNPPGATTGIRLHWPPVTPGATVSLYRKGFGNYPEYDDPPNAGAEPAAPADPAAALAAGWSLAATTQDALVVDVPASRDYWYYVAFVADACGNSSTVSNRAAALSYHLGDITDGTTPGQGDNQVSAADISLLGATYGTTAADPGFFPAVDVGPTADWSATSRPLTDDQIQFEDLMVFSLNYRSVGKTGPAPAPARENALALLVPDLPEPGGILTVTLRLAGDGSIQGLSVPITWNETVLRPVGWAAGELLAVQGRPYLLLSPEPGRLDAALFGGSIAGEGCLARVDFAVLTYGDPGLGLGELGVRGMGNEPLALSGLVSAEPPRATRLLRAMPNPFNPKTTLNFELARAGRVQLRVYAVDGRLERTLADAHYAPGRYQLDWDGRDERGRRAGSGVYFVRMDAVDRSETQKVLLLK